MKKFLLLLSVVLGLSANAQETTTITSFQDFPAMEDETAFTYDGEAITLYQNGKYLFARSIVAVTDDDGSTSYYSYPALLYGNAGQTYTNGDIIPAGWTGTKTTYKGMPEAKISGLEATSGQIDNADVWAAPLDYSGYIQYMTMEQYYDIFAGEYMTFGPVTISEVNGNNFTISETYFNWDTYEYVTSSMPGYNMFYKTVSLPTDLDAQYIIKGFYYIYNDAMQFVPTSFELYYESGDLYSVWAYGDNNSSYLITDELYVVAPTAAEEKEEGSKDYIYFTDNLWEYEEDGEIYDTDPVYMAIDCNGDTELYNKIAAMKTIKAGTLLGKLASNYTNPRLIVTQAPEASENTTVLTYNEVNLNNTFLTNGHNIYGVTGFYDIIDGKEVLRGYDDYHGINWQPIELDRRYIGDVALQQGHQYHFNRVVVKQLTPWSKDDPMTIKAPAAPQEFKIKALNEPKAAGRTIKAPRRMNPYDPNYNTNMRLCPLDAEGIQATGIDEVVDANKQVSKVEYVNVAGQTSDVPFDGVNIMVTRYTDGSSVATKVVK